MLASLAGVVEARDGRGDFPWSAEGIASNRAPSQSLYRAHLYFFVYSPSAHIPHKCTA